MYHVSAQGVDERMINVHSSSSQGHLERQTDGQLPSVTAFCCLHARLLANGCMHSAVVTGCNYFKKQKQNKNTVRVVFRNSGGEDVRPLLEALPRLPVKEGNIFKTATFVFLFVIVVVFVDDGILPPYLSSCIHSFSDSPFQFRWKKIFIVQDQTRFFLVQAFLISVLS